MLIWLYFIGLSTELYYFEGLYHLKSLKEIQIYSWLSHLCTLIFEDIRYVFWRWMNKLKFCSSFKVQLKIHSHQVFSSRQRLQGLWPLVLLYHYVLLYPQLESTLPCTQCFLLNDTSKWTWAVNLPQSQEAKGFPGKTKSDWPVHSTPDYLLRTYIHL